MSQPHSVSRRQFVAGASGLLLAGAVCQEAGAAVENPQSQLAVDGGEKAVQESVTFGPRWGDPEREQLEAMLRQDSLFYWQGPQTTLLTRAVSRGLSVEVRADVFVRHSSAAHCGQRGRHRVRR